MKRTLILIVGILLVGLVSAGLIDYYGQINQTLEVEGLAFYLDGDGNNLLKNEIPDSEEDFNLTEIGEVIFVSEGFGINSLDGPEFEAHVWTKMNGDSDSMEFEIIKVTSENNETICGPETLMVTSDDFREKINSCYSSEEINFDEEDNIAIKISGTGNIRVGHDYSNGYSRVEVSKT